MKFLFYPFKDDTTEARNYVQWSRARGMRVKVHTGGVSRSGASVVCGYNILSWLQPDIAAHVSGGPIPMSDEDIDATVDQYVVRARGLLVGELSLDRACRGAPDREESASPPHARHRYARRHRRHSPRHAAECSVLRLDVQSHAGPGGGGGDRQHRARARPRRWHSGGRKAGRHCGLWPHHRIGGHHPADAIAHGDLPGITHVLIDGEFAVTDRSRQTPPPTKRAFFCPVATPANSKRAESLLERLRSAAGIISPTSRMIRSRSVGSCVCGMMRDLVDQT